MSYDLTIHPAETEQPLLKDALLAIPGARAFESSSTDARSLTFNLNGEDAEIGAFVQRLLAWAKSHAHVIHDPQLGGALERIGQLDWLRPAPRGKTLATKLKNLVKDRLAAHGFEFHKPRILERQLDGLRQGFEFLPPLGNRQAVNVYWRLGLGKELVSGSFTGVVRLNELVPEGVPRSNAPDPFDQNLADLFDFGLPYLERYATIDALLAAVEQGTLSSKAAFGVASDWQVYHRALCLRHVGRTEEAIAGLRDLIANHSLHPWQQHAIRMRNEGKPHFAEQAEADFARLVERGESYVQKERRDYAEELIARWSSGVD